MGSKRHSYRFYCATAFILFVLMMAFCLLWILFFSQRKTPSMSVGFTPPKTGHLGNFYSPHFFAALVSNTTPWRINLETAYIENRENGIAGPLHTALWGGTNNYSSFLHGETMPLPFEVPAVAKWSFRVCFEYSRDAGLLRKFLSSVFQQSRFRFSLPQYAWLREHGLLDGRWHAKYVGAWASDTPAQADGTPVLLPSPPEPQPKGEKR